MKFIDRHSAVTWVDHKNEETQHQTENHTLVYGLLNAAQRSGSRPTSAL
jgi:ABC-type iron transport system FetAB ATPase subunit